MTKWTCAAALAVSLAPIARAAHRDCPMKELAALHVAIDDDGTVLVPVSIEGHQVWMALDLNTGIPNLYSAAIDGWNLKTRRIDIDAKFNRTWIDTMATVKELRLGHAVFSGWHVLLIPRDAKPMIEVYQGKPVVGALTSSFIQVVDLELNLAEKKVNLFSQTTCGARALYWGGEYTAVRMYSDPTGLLKFSMELDDHAIETSLDTASSDSSISPEVAKMYFGFDEASPGIEKQRSHRENIDSYRAMSLTAKGLRIKNAKIKIQPRGHCHATDWGTATGAISCGDIISITPFSIGTDLLRRLRVYIASKEHMIYFTRADPRARAQ